MAVKFQGGRAVQAGGGFANKLARERQISKVMSALDIARDRVFQESQKLPDVGVQSEEWNNHITAMREFYKGIDAVKRTLSLMAMNRN